MGIGQDFQKGTGLAGQFLIPTSKKVHLSSPGRLIALPKPIQLPGTLDQAIRNRRSIRDLVRRPISTTQLAQLTFAAYGHTGPDRGRSAPSAGALYPLDLYVVANRVDGLDQGIYRYMPEPHTLELIIQDQLGPDLALACLGQTFVADAAVVFAMIAEFEKTSRKYGDRGYRYIYMEAGHISHGIYLAASTMGLGSVAVGAFFDRQVNDLFGLDGTHKAVIYLHPVGYPAGL